MSQIFSGKTAWVSGAAGALGHATAVHLAALGARVVLSGRNADSLHAVARTLDRAAQPVEHVVLPLDVRDSASVQKTFDALIAQTGQLDFVVNTTTLPLFGDLLELDDDTWHAVLDTKILGYVRVLRVALPYLAAQGHGSVVNISGRGGKQPNSIHLPGGAANAAVNLITKGLADQYASKGVRVNAVAPGPIRSPRLDAIAAAGKPNTAATGEPAEVASAVSFLLSDAASFINGTVLAVDGGSLATV